MLAHILSGITATRALAEVEMRGTWTLADPNGWHAAIITPADAGPKQMGNMDEAPIRIL